MSENGAELVLCSDCHEIEVRALRSVSGELVPVYCDDCLDERRAWKDEEDTRENF